ncbi:tRNA (adenosine(37)-N6)-dimethylallyltransferase MiaA [Chloroflexota bacterium]
MKRVIAILGPTGVGKSRLALQLAPGCNGEIVNADSRQVYRLMDIGTAKLSPSELDQVPHHLVNSFMPDLAFSVGEYQSLAYSAISDIHRRHKIPMLVGGSGQYLWAVLEGWQVPKLSPLSVAGREEEGRLTEAEKAALYRELVKRDPQAAASIDPKNIRRVLRALEVIKNTGVLFSKSGGKKPPGFQTLIIGLTLERETLYQRVDKRVDDMLAEGLLDETRRLVEAGYGGALPAMSSIGYRQLLAYIAGEIPLAEAVRQIKTGTHRFIRQQYNWFRLADPRIKWLNADENLAEQAAGIIDVFLRSG